MQEGRATWRAQDTQMDEVMLFIQDIMNMTVKATDLHLITTL